ncbi:MAG: flagellar protein FliT [Burkholderiaceae bacterium]|jgi:flagellar protein FliT|nr:flagellar protein FliT [Burkholderiaceae bacterium]HMN63434.1 flagellar protein FliT [Burkholderiaceae bacterium]
MPVFEDVSDPGTPILGQYREIESAAAVMLQAARAGDWARVARIERVIGELATRLDGADPLRRLDPGQRRERLRIVRRLLSIDAEVRHLADPASLQLDRMFTPRSARDPLAGPA